MLTVINILLFYGVRDLFFLS